MRRSLHTHSRQATMCTNNVSQSVWRLLSLSPAPGSIVNVRRRHPHHAHHHFKYHSPAASLAHCFLHRPSWPDSAAHMVALALCLHRMHIRLAADGRVRVFPSPPGADRSRARHVIHNLAEVPPGSVEECRDEAAPSRSRGQPPSARRTRAHASGVPQTRLLLIPREANTAPLPSITKPARQPTAEMLKR